MFKFVIHRSSILVCSLLFPDFPCHLVYHQFLGGMILGRPHVSDLVVLWKHWGMTSEAETMQSSGQPKSASMGRSAPKVAPPQWDFKIRHQNFGGRSSVKIKRGLFEHTRERRFGTLWLHLSRWRNSSVSHWSDYQYSFSMALGTKEWALQWTVDWDSPHEYGILWKHLYHRTISHCLSLCTCVQAT